jgi:hypothetical protein
MVEGMKRWVMSMEMYKRRRRSYMGGEGGYLYREHGKRQGDIDSELRTLNGNVASPLASGWTTSTARAIPHWHPHSCGLYDKDKVDWASGSSSAQMHA